MNIFTKSAVWIGSWIFLGMGLASVAQAQSSAPATSLEELQSSRKLKAGESVQIFDDKGNRLKAKIAEITSSGIAVMVKGQRRDLPLSAVKEIRHRRPERWWDGMVIGMVVGGVLGAAAGAGDNYDLGVPPGALIPIAAAEFGAMGAAIDFAIRHNETVFVCPGVSSSRGLKISPLVSKGQTGLKIAWSF